MAKVLAIGNFDGVHRGHQAIIAAARQEAGTDGDVVAVTFWPHPMAVLRPDQAPPLLTDIVERVRLLHDAGADDVSIVEFTPAVAAWSPRQFIDRVLSPLDPTAVVVGQNFRFGAGASADGHDMAELGGLDVHVLPMLLDDDGPVSSSRVRQSLLDADPGLATRLLGRPFRYSGLVMLGDQRGRTLGFPTANIPIPRSSACFADGVYAGHLIHGDERWPAAVSVGTNPTFGAVSRRVEAHAIGQTNLRLYGERVGVDFEALVRPQQRFSSAEELIAQMTADVRTIVEILD